MSVKVIEQVSRTYTAPYKEKRISCRAIIVNDGKILLSHESKTGIYMSPGGSLEDGETYEECCAREVEEETGFKVKVGKPFVTVNEYCYDILYVSNYFICEITGNGNSALTPTEEFKGMCPKWLDVEEAVEVFSIYSTLTPDHESLYLREYTVLNEYKNSIM